MKKISIIIVTYNSTKHIYDCIDSIYKYNDIGDNLEIVVVDNHSPEMGDMFSALSEKYGRNIIIKDSGKNGGYGYGNNIGIGLSNADIVIIMNPDVRLVQPIFMDIIQSFEDEKIGMAGVDFADGTPAYYFKRGHSSTLKSLFFKYYLKKRKYNAEKMFLSGSFLIFRKGAFIKAGAFDEHIFMYSEEADITNRILASGYKVIWLDRVKVFHLAHGRTYNPFLDRVRNESGYYYEEKYGIDHEKEYKKTRSVLIIKMTLARLLFKSKKYQVLKKDLTILDQFHNEKSIGTINKVL